MAIKVLDEKQYAGNPRKVMRLATMVVAAAFSCSYAAENLIVNGDFEASANVAMKHGHYAYANESGGRPPSWNVSPAGRVGLHNRSGINTRWGMRTFMLERRKNETSVVEASQSFTIPAPGIYTLSLDYSAYSTDTGYDLMTLHADVIGPDGAATRINDFKPSNREDIFHASFKSPRLAVSGAETAYTLRFYMTDSTTYNYGYNEIDNIDFSLYTLSLEAGESFSGPASLGPHEISLAANSTLTLVADSNRASIDGCVTFAEGSKIVFDLSSFDGAQHVFRTGGMIFPEGAEDPAQFFELSGGDGFSLHFIEDGKTVLASKASAPFSAEWTGAGDSATLLDPANWTCRNFAGEAVSGVPCDDTLDLKLGADADWRVSGAPAVSPFAALDLNGHALSLSGLSQAEFAGERIFSSSAATLRVSVEEGERVNSTIALSGAVKLVKDGAGTFVAAKAGQSYTGGTEVTDGTLKLGANAAFGALANLVVNGDFDNFDNDVGSNAIAWRPPFGWTSEHPTWIGVSRGNNYYVSSSTKCMVIWVYSDFETLAEQSITVEEAGDYRLSFYYAGGVGSNQGGETDVTLEGNGEERLLAKVTGTTTSFRWYVTQVRIDNPGTYVLKFHLRSPSKAKSCSMGFDDIVFAKCVDVAAVGESAVLDVNGQYDCTVDYTYRLAGGTLTSGAGTSSAWTRAMLRDVRVEADSNMSFPQAYGMITHNYAGTFVDLGGKTLTLDSGTSTFYVSGATFTEGTLSIDGGYMESFYNAAANDFRRAKVVMNGNSVLRCNSNSAVPLFGDLEVNSTLSDTSTDFPVGIKVFGTFKPNTDNFHGCELQDGATLDLSGRVGAFSTKGAYAGGTAAQTTVTFAKGAAVTIDLHGRRDLSSFRKGAGRVVEWEAGAAPDGVTFSLDEATGKRGYRIEQVEGGLSLSWKLTGLLILVH